MKSAAPWSAPASRVTSCLVSGDTGDIGAQYTVKCLHYLIGGLGSAWTEYRAVGHDCRARLKGHLSHPAPAYDLTKLPLARPDRKDRLNLALICGQRVRRCRRGLRDRGQVPPDAKYTNEHDIGLER